MATEHDGFAGAVSFNLDGASAATGVAPADLSEAIFVGDLVAHYVAATPIILPKDLAVWIESLPTGPDVRASRPAGTRVGGLARVGAGATEPMRRLLGYPQLAAYLGLGVTKAKKLAAEGAFPKVKVEGRILFDRVDVDAYVDRIKRSS